RRPLGAKQGTVTEKTLLGTAAMGARLDVGAYHAGGALGAQRDGGTRLVAVDENVHLLLDDVRGFTAAAAVEVGALQHRGANLGKAVGAHQRAHLLLDQCERARVGTKRVLKSPESRQFHL